MKRTIRLTESDIHRIVIEAVRKIVRKNRKENQDNIDAIKAMRRGSREAEMEMLGPGFHSPHKIHKSKKEYTRKPKHKGREKYE